MELRTARFLLRPCGPADADAVYRACQDPDIARWTRIPQPYTRESAEFFVTVVAAETGKFGIFDLRTEEFLGTVGLVDLVPHDRFAEVGYWVAPWARGRGVAVEATRGIARWALTDLGIERLLWRAEVGNHASRRVAEAAGFRMEGVARAQLPRRDGSLADAWSASLTPADLGAIDGGSARTPKVFDGAQPVLPAGPLTLTAPEARDVAAIVETVVDPESQGRGPLPPTFGPADARRQFVDFATGHWLRGDGVLYAVRDPDGAFVGTVQLNLDPQDARIGEISYLTAPAHRGRGHATAALRALVAWAFDELGLARIVWRAQLDNPASVRVAEKVGFVPEGTQRAGIALHGRREDVLVGSMLATDPRPAS